MITFLVIVILFVITGIFINIVDKIMNKFPDYEQIKRNKWMRMKKKWREENKELS